MGVALSRADVLTGRARQEVSKRMEQKTISLDRKEIRVIRYKPKIVDADRYQIMTSYQATLIQKGS